MEIIQGKEYKNGVWFKTRDNIEFIPFQNYFYIKFGDYINMKLRILNKTEHISAKDIYNNPQEFTKIILDNNLDRTKLKYEIEKLGIKTYEADINAVKRYLLDKPEQVRLVENILWYDIETDDRGSFDKDPRGKILATSPILSIAYQDNQGRKHWMKNENIDNPDKGERDLLFKHNQIIKQYDLILGWNSQGFDETYIKQRNFFHKIDNTDWDFINKLDYMLMVKKNLKGLESYSLNGVAQNVLKQEKIDIGKKGHGTIYNAWLNSFKGDNLLQEYNEMDVQLMVDIEKKLKFIDLHIKESNIANCFIQDTLYDTDICDYILLRKFKEQGYISPSKPTEQEKEDREESILGAYTFCYEPGVHSNVHVFDFKSFYPTTMAANNICTTTLLKRPVGNYLTIPENELERAGVMEVAETKWYTNERQGIISGVAYWLVTERDKIKYEKFKYINSDPDKFKTMKLDEMAIKILANSLYGALSYKNFRYYDFYVAGSVTQFCRGVIVKCVQLAQHLGFKVIQGDTDSIMFTQHNSPLTLKELEYHFYLMFDIIAKERNIKNKVFMLKNPKTGEFEKHTHFIVFEHEKTFHRMISVKKKHYADICELLDGDGKSTGQVEISITGLECKKKDTNPLAKELQLRLVENILKDSFDSNELLNSLKRIKYNLNDNEIESKYLVMTKTLTKNPSEFGRLTIDSKTGNPKIKKDGTPMSAPVPAYIKLVERLIEQGEEIFVGDNIQYIVKENKPIVAISVEEYEKGSEFDKEYYWIRFITPTLKILFVTHPQLIIDNYELWSWKELNEKQKERYLVKLKKEVETEDD